MKKTYWIIGLIILAVLLSGKNTHLPFMFTSTEIDFQGHPVNVQSDSSGNMYLAKNGDLSYVLSGSQGRNALQRGGDGYVKLTFEDVSIYDSFSIDFSATSDIGGDERGEQYSETSLSIGPHACNKQATLAKQGNQGILKITKLNDGIYEVISSCGTEVIKTTSALRPELKIESRLSGSPYPHNAGSSLSVTAINAKTKEPSVPPTGQRQDISIIDFIGKLIKAIISFILIPFVPPL